MDAVLSDWRTAEVTPRIQAALELLERMTLRPLEVDDRLIAQIKSELDDTAIQDTVAIGFHFNWFNRFSDAFDFDIPTPAQRARLARLMNSAAKLFRHGDSGGEPTTARDARIRPTALDKGLENLLSTSGVTSSTLRKQVAHFAAELWRNKNAATLAAEELPLELRDYTRKLALHAYRIMDDEVEALRHAGYGEEAIFELTIVGSYSASLVGVEQTYAAMQ